MLDFVGLVYVLLSRCCRSVKVVNFPFRSACVRVHACVGACVACANVHVCVNCEYCSLFSSMRVKPTAILCDMWGLHPTVYMACLFEVCYLP